MPTIGELLTGNLTQAIQPVRTRIQDNINRRSNGNQNLTTAFRDLLGGQDATIKGFNDDIFSQYSAFEQALNPTFSRFLTTNEQIRESVIPSFMQSQEVLQNTFGPGGEGATEINALFQNLNRLTELNEQGQITNAANRGRAAGANRSAILRAQEDARNNALKQIADVQQRRIGSLQDLATNFLNFSNALRSERINTDNQLLVQPLLQIANQRQNILSSLNNAITGERDRLNNLEAQRTLAASNPLQSYLNALSGGTQQTTQPAQQTTQIFPSGSINRNIVQPLLFGRNGTIIGTDGRAYNNPGITIPQQQFGPFVR